MCVVDLQACGWVERHICPATLCNSPVHILFPGVFLFMGTTQAQIQPQTWTIIMLLVHYSKHLQYCPIGRHPLDYTSVTPLLAIHVHSCWQLISTLSQALQ